MVPQVKLDIQDNLDYIFMTQGVTKEQDFDPKFLLFDPIHVRYDIRTHKISFNEKDRFMFCDLVTNTREPQDFLRITVDQYDRLKRLYWGPSAKFHERLAILLLRYGHLGGMNNHLSVPPRVYKTLGVRVELFGSPFNTCTSQYCSPFGEIESHFGSAGSFFNYTLQSNTVYSANPPFDAVIIKKMAAKLTRELNRTENVTVYISIPFWKNNFIGFEILRDSQHFKEYCVLPNYQFPYYNYYRDKLIPVIDTYWIVFSNTDSYCDCAKLQQIWCQQSSLPSSQSSPPQSSQSQSSSPQSQSQSQSQSHQSQSNKY